MIKCYFHSADLDGHCSGAIVKYKFPEAQLIPIDYGTKIDYSKISKDDTIYMVDFSLQPFSEMYELRNYVGASNFIWIDHHVSAIKDADEFPIKMLKIVNSAGGAIELPPSTFNTECIGKRQEDGKAGCELTWEYLFPDDEMPAAVRLLGRYDVWDLEDPQVLEFQHGIRLENTDPNNQLLWKEYFEPLARDRVKINKINGRTILAYQKQENKKYCNASVFELEFEGYKAICSNKMLNNSQFFESVWDNQKYDIMISFGLHKNGLWTFSFYTDKDGVDCSIIAKKLGGGGHKQAAGCSFKQLPTEFMKQIKKLQPVKYEPIPSPEDGDHMLIHDFEQAVKDNFFTDEDGTGYYATETQMTNKVVEIKDIINNKNDDHWSHVVWFNK